MRVIRVNQQASAAIQMAILGQYSEQGIRVMLSNASGEGRKLGRITQLVPMHDHWKVTIDYDPGVKPLKPNQLDGFVFSNFYGRYFLSKPLEGK